MLPPHDTAGPARRSSQAPGGVPHGRPGRVCYLEHHPVGWHLDTTPDGAKHVTIYPFKPGGRGKPIGGGTWRWNPDHATFHPLELWPRPDSPLGQDPTVHPSPRDPLARRPPPRTRHPGDLPHMTPGRAE